MDATINAITITALVMAGWFGGMYYEGHRRDEAAKAFVQSFQAKVAASVGKVSK